MGLKFQLMVQLTVTSDEKTPTGEGGR